MALYNSAFRRITMIFPPRRSWEYKPLRASSTERATEDGLSTEHLDHPSLHSTPRPFTPSRRSSFSSISYDGLSSITSRRDSFAFSTSQRRSRPSFLRGSSIVVAVVFASVIIWILFNAIFCPSYTQPPAHYESLQNRMQTSKESGRGNVNNEKIFIAANIINESKIRGPWGKSLLELIELLGDDNVFVSVYENDSPDGTTNALKELESNSSIVTGAHIDLDSLPNVTLATGEQRVKRISYMAEIRNQALRPLDAEDVSGGKAHTPGLRFTSTRYDRLLFLNDVYFSPTEAVHLLFSTNAQHGRANYRAACAADFVSVTNYYDAYATRDLDGHELGYGPGLRYFPWFANIGASQSRKDILAGLDTVRVSSCWGGMVAFDAAWFQPSVTERRPDYEPGNDTAAPHPSQNFIAEPHSRSPVRFRAEPEPYWDASECCLIHADIQSADINSATPTAGVYLNPFVRTAYTLGTYRWLPTVRRVERAFVPLQRFLTWWNKYPAGNSRRTQKAGEEVLQTVWRDGGYVTGPVVARPGGFCGKRAMGVMRPDLGNNRKDGGNWEGVEVPRD